MRQAAKISSTSVTVHVPLAFRIRGGRRSVLSDGILPPSQARTDNALLKALAQAHHWRKQIEAGEYASITELAKARGVNESYACRLLRLTLLAPTIVTAILDGRQKSDLMLKQLTKPFPTKWDEQLKIFSSRTQLCETCTRHEAASLDVKVLAEGSRRRRRVDLIRN